MGVNAVVEIAGYTSVDRTAIATCDHVNGGDFFVTIHERGSKSQGKCLAFGMTVFGTEFRRVFKNKFSFAIPNRLLRYAPFAFGITEN